MKTKKLISAVLAIVTLLSVVCINIMPASALSINSKYPTQNITGYIMSTGNKTAVAYSNSNCNSSIGYIYANDDCTIQAIYTNGAVKVKCPWSGYSGGRVVYTKLSYFFSNTSSVSTITATTKTRCYSKSNLSTSLGYVYVGDRCYVVGNSGNYYQVLCPWSGGVYRICWVSKSAFGHTHNYSSSGFEAAHPHKVYRKCSCGAFYYTGETKKYASCTICYPPSLNINKNYPTKNITGYILSTSNKTATAYSDSGLKNYVGYIYANDDCTIQAIYTNGVVKVKCPWSGYSGGRVVYTKLSYFFSNTSSVSTKKAIAKTRCYSKSNISTSLGYVYSGDNCYIVGSSGNYYQVLCPWSGNTYRICWVNQSVFSHTHNYSTTGVEAAHPHKVYRKCSCGAYY